MRQQHGIRVSQVTRRTLTISLLACSPCSFPPLTCQYAAATFRDGAVRTWDIDHKEQKANLLADYADTHRGQAIEFFRFKEGENVAIITNDGMVSMNQLDYQAPTIVHRNQSHSHSKRPKPQQRTKMLFSVQKEISCARVKESSTPTVRPWTHCPLLHSLTKLSAIYSLCLLCSIQQFGIWH